MISTVTSKLDPQYGVIDALKNNFSWEAWLERQRSAMKIIDQRRVDVVYTVERLVILLQMVILILMLLFGYFVQSRKKTMYRFLWECHCHYRHPERNMKNVY
jgi:hypothetical protein